MKTKTHKSLKRKVRMTRPDKLHDFQKQVSNMKYKDLQIACIVRGMLFEDVVKADWHGLYTFYNNNFIVVPKRGLIDDYDDWMDAQLDAKGYPKDHPIRSKWLRKGFIGSYDEDGNIAEVKKPRIKGIANKTRQKRERNEMGIFKGTKKELTYLCQKKGMTLEETKKEVIAKFPEAVDKSIRIWYNKAKKLNAPKA